MSVLTAEEIEKRISDSYELPNKVLELIPEPLVSIRTSTYNHGPYIKECIEGVLMQKTTFPVEYIIGEDYSTDETRSIVFEYAQKYPEKIRVITADYNVGSKANGRRCIRACRGKYIALCEGDDYWTDPYKLQKQVEILDANKQYSFSAHNYNILQDDKLTVVNQIMKNEYNIYELAKRMHIQMASVVYRKEIIESDLYNRKHDDNFFRGDHYLFLTAAKYGLLYYFNDTMSVYRIHSGGMSSGKTFAEVIDNLSVPLEKAVLKDFSYDKKLCAIIYKKLVYQSIILLIIYRNKLSTGKFFDLSRNFTFKCDCLTFFDRIICVLLAILEGLYKTIFYKNKYIGYLKNRKS
jgi:glycosyltransferase involved in cell wall biosynthesis